MFFEALFTDTSMDSDRSFERITPFEAKSKNSCLSPDDVEQVDDYLESADYLCDVVINSLNFVSSQKINGSEEDQRHITAVKAIKGNIEKAKTFFTNHGKRTD